MPANGLVAAAMSLHAPTQSAHGAAGVDVETGWKVEHTQPAYLKPDRSGQSDAELVNAGFVGHAARSGSVLASVQ